MDKLKWDKKLAVGIDELDAQHQNIIRALNEMLEAMSHGKGHQKYYSLLKFLENHIYEHFTLEEALMTRYGYADYEEHRRTHQEFSAKFLDFKQQFEAEGPTVRIVIKTMNWLGQWLVEHIMETDKKYVAFLKPRLEEEGRSLGEHQG